LEVADGTQTMCDYLNKLIPSKQMHIDASGNASTLNTKQNGLKYQHQKKKPAVTES
jgi:methionine synthase I (cobalamin-dependent)